MTDEELPHVTFRGESFGINNEREECYLCVPIGMKIIDIKISSSVFLKPEILI